MGAWVTQDLLVALLGIWQEIAKQSEIMWQMLQVAMAQLEVMSVMGIDLVSQAEAVCQCNVSPQLWMGIYHIQTGPLTLRQ